MTVRAPAWRVAQAETVRMFPMTDISRPRRVGEARFGRLMRVLGDHVARLRGESFGLTAAAYPPVRARLDAVSAPTLHRYVGPEARFPKDAA